MSADYQMCTFTLGGLLFGLDVLRVREVLRPQTLTRVPLAPPSVRGLINLRGEIVTAVDLRQRLGMPERPAGSAPPMNVVVETDGGPVSLLVDDVGDVLAAPEAAFEPPPETLRGAARELIRGAFKLDGSLLLVLDLGRTLAGVAGEPLAPPLHFGEGVGG